MNLVVLSENSLLVLFEQKISHDIFSQVSRAVNVITANLSDLIVDIVPSYASILIVFKPDKIKASRLSDKVSSLIDNMPQQQDERKEKPALEIPVYYGQEVAFDIELVATQCRISVDEVISIHSQTIYDVFATGFSPGFSYMGIVDERIAVPRKRTPRLTVPGGSLAIAERQTAIYPSESPGGWQIIGRSPLSMIDYSHEELTRFKTGERVKFIPIDRAEFLSLGGQLP